MYAHIMRLHRSNANKTQLCLIVMHYALLCYDGHCYYGTELCYMILYYQNISAAAFVSACNNKLFMDDTYNNKWWFQPLDWSAPLNTLPFMLTQIYAVICIMAIHHWEWPTLVLSVPEHRLQLKWLILACDISSNFTQYNYLVMPNCLIIF